MSALYSLLEDGECDVAFNLSPYVHNYHELSHRFLKSHPLMAVLYPGHPLTSRKHLSHRDLSGEEFIIMQPKGGPMMRRRRLSLLRQGGFSAEYCMPGKEVQTLPADGFSRAWDCHFAGICCRVLQKYPESGGDSLC